MGPRFGTDGLRGVANCDLTPEVALSLGRAVARVLSSRHFLVGRDTRRSGSMLEAGLAAGLASEGVDVELLGVLPTPAIAFTAGRRAVPAAVISASHNPFEDNGIKLVTARGTKLCDEAEREIEAELEYLIGAGLTYGPAVSDASIDEKGRRPRGAAIGSVRADTGAVEAYLDHLIGIVGGTDLSCLRVVIDCANGAASAVGPAVLERLGVTHIAVETSPNGVNINAGCGSTHPDRVAREVLETGADLGLTLDGDADRVLAVDHAGQVVDGDQLLAIFARDLKERGRLGSNTIAATVMSNLGLHRGLERLGIVVVETPVGDRQVAEALEREDLVLGGEQSGHLIFRDHATTGDGLLTGLLLLEVLARHRASLAELAGRAMLRFPQEMRSVAVPDPRRLGASSALSELVAEVEAELGGDGRVLLRASGTESVVRVMVEARSNEIAVALAERIAAAVRAELGTVRA